MSERALELKVGLFLLAALAILVAFVLVLGDFRLGGTYRIYADYNFSGAIESGAPVRVSGVEIGQVREVQFLGAGVRDDQGVPLLVRLALDLEERAQEVVRTDTEFLVSTQGVLGEAYVEVLPGSLQGEVLPEGAVVRGVDPTRVDLLLQRMSSVLDGLADTLTENRDAIAGLLDAGGGLARTLDEVLVQNRDQIRQGLLDVSAATGDLKRVAAALAGQMEDGGDLQVLLAEARAATGSLRRDLPPLLSDARKAAAELARLSEVTGELGPEDMERIRGTIARYEQLGAGLSETVTDLQALLERLESGKGTFGALLQDEQIYDDLRELIRDVKQHPWKLLRKP